MKTNSKILVIAIVAIIIMSAFSFVNASSAKADLEAYLKDKHVICGRTYQVNAEQAKAISDYLNSKELSDSACDSAKAYFMNVLGVLNNSATKASDILESEKGYAMGSLMAAGNLLGVDIKVDLGANTISVTDKETGKSLGAISYETSAEGDLVFGGNAGTSVGGSNAKQFHQDSSAPLVFRFSVDYSNFQNGGKVYVDDKEIDSSKYISKSGSTIIELKPEYLKTLGVGAHTITVAFTNGQRLSEGFEVLAGANNGGNGGAVATSAGNPATTGKAFAYTGNDSIAYIALSLLAVAAVSTTFVKKVNEK